MKINTKLWSGLAAGFAVLFLATSASAQSGDQSNVFFKTSVDPAQAGQVAAAGGRGGAVAFSSVEISPSRQPVTGAPYSAQVTTETIQQLADGNTISHKSTSSVYRDAQGRTRREQSMSVVGIYQPSASGGENLLKQIIIDDPVSGNHYTLDPIKKVATQFGTNPIANGMNSVSPMGTYELKRTPDGTVSVSVGPMIVSPKATIREAVPDDETETLGAQTIEGLTVIGTRYTHTIPAGQIGNQQPILVITEKWYSPDLQIDVITKHSDPRTGTTTTTVSNLSRNEPAASLFTIPPDYMVKPAGAARGGVLAPAIKQPM